MPKPRRFLTQQAPPPPTCATICAREATVVTVPVTATVLATFTLPAGAELDVERCVVDVARSSCTPSSIRISGTVSIEVEIDDREDEVIGTFSLSVAPPPGIIGAGCTCDVQRARCLRAREESRVGNRVTLAADIAIDVQVSCFLPRRDISVVLC